MPPPRRTTRRPRPQTPEEGGGAGGTYEEWVVAWYLLQLLRGGPVHGLGTLIRVVTQTRPEEWLLDDIRLHLKSGAGEHRLAIECKSGSFLSAAGVPERETVDRAWRLLVGSADPPFREGHDQMVVVVREWSRSASSAWRALEKAAPSGIAAVRRAAQGGTRERILAGLSPPADLGLEGDAADPVRLLSHLRVVRRELGDEGDEHDDEAVRRCARLLDDPSDARKLWDALGRLARRRQHASEFTEASLVAELRSAFALRVLPDHRRILEDLQQWQAEDFSALPAHIGGIHIPRRAVAEQLRAAVAAHPVVALVGASGVGKTALVRELTAESLGIGALLIARASRLTAANVSRIGAALRAHPYARGVLIVDGVDRDPDGAGVDHVAALLRAVVGEGGSWSVVLSSSDGAWPSVWASISRVNNDLARPPAVAVGPFLSAEVDQVLAPVGERLPLATRHRLRPLLSNPWWLNRVVDTVLFGVELPAEGTIGPSILGRLWWDRVLDDVDADGSARAQATALAPAIATKGGQVRPAPAELRLLAPLVALGVLEQRNREVQFAHARFEEVALARYLVETVSEEVLAEWRGRTSSLRWRPALVLAAAEIAEADTARWVSLVSRLDPGRSADADLLALLVEALLHTSEPERTLVRVSNVLLGNSARLLEVLSSQLRGRLVPRPAPEDWERTAWRALLQWASAREWPQHDPSLRAIYPLLEGAGFYSRFLDLPRTDLRVLAGLVFARTEEALRLGDELSLDDPALLRAFVVVLDLDIDRARPLVRMLCGRERRPAPPPSATPELSPSRPPRSVLAMSFPAETAPAEPWPGGPVAEPIQAFREVALTAHGLIGLYNADPALAVETILALFIEEPESREPWWMGHHLPGLILPGFEWSARVTDDFFVPVEVFARDWVMLLSLALKVSAFAAQALEVYRAETRGPAEEPVRLEGPKGLMEYPGGRKLWQVGRGQAQPTEVVGYVWKRLGEVLRAEAAPDVYIALIVRSLLRCPSTAALGFLCRMVTEAPDLMAGDSSALLQDPRLTAWECERAPDRHPGALVLAARDAWFRTGWTWPAIERARGRWEADLAAGRCPDDLRGWTRNLVTWFDQSRWSQERVEDGQTSWVWHPDKEQQERNQQVKATNNEVFGALQLWGVARRLLDEASPLSLAVARRLLDAAIDLPDLHFQAAEARVAVGCAVASLAPELLGDADTRARVVGWLEPAFDRAAVDSVRGVVLGHVDAAAAAANIWARDSLGSEGRLVAAWAISVDDDITVRTFFRVAATYRTLLHAEFRRLLVTGFAYRAVRPGSDTAPAQAAAIEAFIHDTAPAPGEPVSPDATGHPDWLAPMTRWVREVPRDADVDAIVQGIDACLRAEVARVLASARERDGALRKGRATGPRDLKHPPSQYQIDLLRTLAGWLLELPRVQAEAVLRPWLRAADIPPEWLAWLIDALYEAALAKPDDHRASARLLTYVVGSVLDDPGWQSSAGTILHPLCDRTLGVGYSAHGTEAWTVAAAPLLQDLRDLRHRWVERACASDSAIFWLTALGRTAAADGVRSEFATLLLHFAPEARRRDPHVEHIAAFLRMLVTDSSFRRPDAAAEILLADVRAARIRDAIAIEVAMRGDPQT